MTSTLAIQVEFVQENMHKLVVVLHPSALGRVALPINEALLEPAKTL